MTQASCVANGSSLEDCHTNFFALADLCGIKWRQYSCDINFNDLNDDPILNSYAKCVNANLLCVWRRVRTQNSQEQPIRDLYINYSKELWIFWYGDEPDLKEIIYCNLKEGESGSWESGVSYECRTLLFKALHNLIERCLLSKGYSRIGNWFFQLKCRDICDILKEGTQTTFSLNFFLHGDSNVCANVNVHQHCAVRTITKEDVLLAQQMSEGLPILLAPYGIQGYLTGFVYKDNDQNIQKFLFDWNQIYPLSYIKQAAKEKTNSFPNTFNTNNNNINHDDNNNGNDFINKVVDVIVGDHRMKYPVSYVFITETDFNIAKAKLIGTGKLGKTLTEIAVTVNKQSNEHLETIKLIMSPYYNYLPDNTYFLKDTFNQVINICDQNHSNKLERSKSENNFANNSNELILRKNCNCVKCQNPNFRKHSKSNYGSSSSSSFGIKSKNIDKGKRNSVPFHHRVPMNLIYDDNLFCFLTNSLSTQSNIDGSPLSGNVSINNSNNQSNISSMIMPYKSPVSTSTSSILNTPGIESSPMSNFNIESHEHISPLPSSKEEISLINTPTNINNNNPLISSPKDKSTFDQINSVNNNINNTNINGDFETQNLNTNCAINNGEISNPVAIPVNSITEQEVAKLASQTCHLDKRHFKRCYRYKSIYDDDSTYKLRTGLLYDFSYEETWEEPLPKNRRFKSSASNLDESYSEMTNLDNHDPYEFSDLDETDYGNCLKLNNDLLNSNLSNNIAEFSVNNNTAQEYNQLNKINDCESGPKYVNGNINGNILIKNNETFCDIEFPATPADDITEYPNGKIFNNCTVTNDTESMITTLNNSNSLGAAELLRMFPTPPSLEAMVSSPCSNYVSSEVKSEKIESANELDKNESNNISNNDFDFKELPLVYMPPVQSIFITSNKYAPLENIECKNTLPSSFLYKYNSSRIQIKGICQGNNFQSNANSYLNKSKPPYSMAANKANTSLIRSSRNNCQNMMPINSPMHSRLRNPTPTQYSSNMIQDNYNSSPLPSIDNRRSPFMFSQQLLNSPSNSNQILTNSSLNNNNIPPNLPLMGPNLYQNMNSNSIDNNLSECNSLMLNLLLSDSMFNLFRDHNFESCSICVCNMNIKGNDVGIYLSDSASVLQQQNSSNYDYYSPCTCGFSAITNRHLSHFSGLFYEDEVEITGNYYDPIESNKENNNNNSNYELTIAENYFDKELKKCLNNIDENFLMLLITQSATIFPSASTLANLMYCDSNQRWKTFNLKEKNIKNDPLKIIYDDYVNIITISLQMARLDSNPNMLMPSFNAQNLRNYSRPILHDWQFKKSYFPVNNHEVMLTLKSLQPLMQESVQRKDSMNEVIYNTVQGPLTWRQFHRLAGRGTEYQCEPQPIPSLLVGYDKECVALSPFGLKFWEKLSLEPYAINRDVHYIVITQDDDHNHSIICNFFKELSITYDMLRLGRHLPLNKVSPDGIYILGNNNSKYEFSFDDWFNQLGDSCLAHKIRSYAQALYDLLPYLTTNERGLFESKSNENCNNSNNNNVNNNNSNNNNISMMNNLSMNGNVSNSFVSNASSSASMLSNYNNNVNAQKSMNNFNQNTEHNPVERLLNDLEPHSTSQETSGHGNSFHPYQEEEDPHKYPSIMIYIVESFSSLSKDVAKLGSLGILKAFSILKKYFPEPMKNNIHMQLLSVNSVIRNDRDFRDYPKQSQLKELAFAVYSQCKQQLVMQSNIKSLTGLGPAASLELFLKNKNSCHNRTQLYTTPFILAPLKDKQTELGEMFGDRREKCQILYCSYCLTEDKKWLIASCTNDKGDILHTKVININIPNRTRRKKACARKFGLNKLMRFIQTVMAESVLPWRLIIGRLGRIGHGELKDWTYLLSKKSLLKYSRQLREMCEQCRHIGQNEQPAIYSACLISLEADTALRVFPNYFTPDERFSISCNTCSLSTPEDASCTHILVFPTSATTQSNMHNNFNLGEEFFANLDESDIPVEDDMEFFENFFSDNLLSDGRDGHQPDSPGNRQVFGVSNSLKNSSLLEVEQDEPTQLLQQPLALAFYVSTAKTGPLPRWFWAHCPHLEKTCPVFLKSALLIHTPFVQQNSDDILQANNRDCHSLDSSLTTDVLRYSLEGYNALSWLVLDPVTYDRLSCLPLHIQVMMQLYHTVQALVQ